MDLKTNKKTHFFVIESEVIATLYLLDHHRNLIFMYA
jgi:hypothetical protein